MPKIKYVGLKLDGETAFSQLPGAPAVWMPGDSFDVAEPLASRMLAHPDVFGLDDGDAQPPVPEQAPAPVANVITKADGTQVTLDDLSKEDLHALAAELGVPVHHNAGPAKVIAAIMAVMAAEDPEGSGE